LQDTNFIFILDVYIRGKTVIHFLTQKVPMKTQVQNPPAVGSTILRLAFLGSVVLGCVYAIVALCAAALKILE
jgi:hypothetical protein